MLSFAPHNLLGAFLDPTTTVNSHSLWLYWSLVHMLTLAWENIYLCAVLQVESLWVLLCPLLRTALSNITVETYADWGTCIATACVSIYFPYIHYVFILPFVKLLSLTLSSS